MSERPEGTPKDTTGRSGRWQRRDQRRISERNRLQKHGADLRTTYRNAILKRLRDRKRK